VPFTDDISCSLRHKPFRDFAMHLPSCQSLQFYLAILSVITHRGAVAAQLHRRNLPQVAPEADVKAVAPHGLAPAAAGRAAAPR